MKNNTKNIRKGITAGLFAAIMMVCVLAVVPVVSATVTMYDKNRLGWEADVVTWETEDFADTTLNLGVSVAADWANAAVTGGVWYDRLVKSGEYDSSTGQRGPTTTTWTFDEPIFAYGGTWDPGTPGGPGASIAVSMDGASWESVGVISCDYVNEFWGFTSTEPFTHVLLEPGTTTVWCETYELDNMVYSFLPIEVEKDYRFTDVCFEKDNDLDGLFNEDPVNFDVDGNAIDDDGDGRYNEDDVDCPEGTSLGTLLPTDADGDYIVEAVVKNGKVKSYNPGQYYAVSTVNVLEDVDTLTIVENWCDCEDISALSPKQGGGYVVIVEIRDDVAYQILDAKSDEVTVDTCTAMAELEDVSAGTTILMYVKFGPAQKHGVFTAGTCENVNSAKANFVAEDSASAMLELIKKV